MKINNYLLPKAILLGFFSCSVLAQAKAQLPPLTQCSPSLIPSFVVGCGSAANAYISGLTTTGGINNITNNNTNCGNTTTSYSDYTGTSMKVTQEATKSINVNVTWVGNSSTSYNTVSTITKIYVDWNRDGDFDDVDEFIAPAQTSDIVHGAGTKTIKVTVPGHAKDGLTRMRIVTGAQNYLYDPATNACGGAKYGEAEDYVFEVINPCFPPNTISVANLDYKSADFAWTTKLNADMYEYLITTADTIPDDTVIGFTFTKATTVDVDTFRCNTKYYILVRVICDSNSAILAKNWSKSAWMRDSFTTDPCCYTPVVTVDQVGSTTARASWNPVPTAYGYEYAASTTPTPPQQGTYTTNTVVFLQGLSSKTTYFIHVRTRCSPTPFSDWTKSAFKTGKTTSVNSVPGTADFSIDVYPNPIKEKLYIQLNGDPGNNARVMVMDLTGKMVYNELVTSQKVEIDAAQLASGVYIVKYTDDVHNEIMKVTK